MGFRCSPEAGQRPQNGYKDEGDRLVCDPGEAGPTKQAGCEQLLKPSSVQRVRHPPDDLPTGSELRSFLKGTSGGRVERLSWPRRSQKFRATEGGSEEGY